MTESGPGLSMYHISPQNLPGRSGFEPGPRIKFRRGASLLSCELGKTQGTRGKKHDWVRGAITHFSKQSRRRILRLVASLKRSVTPVFCTLTYPDLYPEDPRIWKKHLDTLFKRMLREYPKAIVIWRLERKERKTGENQGKIAPHFHLLAYGVPYVSLLHWLPLAWFETVKSGDPRHFNAGTRVEPVRSVQGVLYYTSKYICKSENDELEGIGRMWGIVGRSEVIRDEKGEVIGKHNKLQDIQGEFEVIELDGATAMTVLRYMRRKASELYHKGRYRGRRKVPKWGIKFTLIGDAEFWYGALPKIRAMGDLT